MIKQIEQTTLEYQKKVSKEERKSKAQFFTTLSIAEYMSSLSKKYDDSKALNVLDCGAGTGILACSLIDKLKNDGFNNEINIDLYENDEKVIEVLRENMRFYSENYDGLNINIIQDNFILANKDTWKNNDYKGKYDIVIANPPYKKLKKSEEESIVMNEVVHGQPNIYFLFMAMSLKLLKIGGEMISITPRSFTSGAYFKEFRSYLLNNAMLTNIHIFNSRDKLFKGEEVLQETIITRAIKGFVPNRYNLKLTISNDADFEHIKKLEVCSSDLITDCKNGFILLPSSDEEVEILNKISKYHDNLISLGFKLKTGKVVDFRATQYLTQDSNGAVPLFWADNFINNKITIVDNQDNFRYVISNDNSKSILQDNKDYILVKRFTAKEEIRRIQPAIYNHLDFNDFDKIGVENHVNFIEKESGNMSKEEQYGIFCYFNSTMIDKYYRVINGNTQVNATEFNAIPMPNITTVKELGRELIESTSLDSKTCDSILKKYI